MITSIQNTTDQTLPATTTDNEFLEIISVGTNKKQFGHIEDNIKYNWNKSEYIRKHNHPISLGQWKQWYEASMEIYYGLYCIILEGKVDLFVELVLMHRI